MVEYASKPLAQKDTFYKQNEAALQAYSRAASQLDKMGISSLVDSEKVQQLVSETEAQINKFITQLENLQQIVKTLQLSKETVEKIQYGDINSNHSDFSRL